MLSTTKRALATAGATVVAIGSLLVPATAAQATPSGCSSRADNDEYSVYCSRGTGDFRARANCYKITTGRLIYRYGGYQHAGGEVWSTARCLSGEELGGGKWQFR